MKTIGGLRKTRYRGRTKTWPAAYLVASAYNLSECAVSQQRPDETR